MKLPLTLICIFLLSISITSAQTPVVEWHRSLGGFNGDYARSVVATSDGGYILSGSTEFSGGDVMGYHGGPVVNDYWVVKVNNRGDIEWQKCLGGTFHETGADIKQTPDGGYIVAGSSASKDCNVSVASLGLDYWIVKLATNGDIQWQTSVGGSKNDYAYAIDLTPDGGYIIAGHTESNDGDLTVNQGSLDAWIVKLNSTGALQWQKSLGGAGEDAAYSVRATADGGCVMAGYTLSGNSGDVTGNHGNRDFWIAKLGNGGNLQWQKCYGGTENETAQSIQSTPDGGYVVTGMAASNNGDVSGNHHGLGPGSADYWVIKIDAAGTLQWQKCYGGDKNEWPYFIQLTPDGGYIINGYSESADHDVPCNAGISDMWLVKISGTGAQQWQKVMGGNSFDVGFGVVPLNDGSYIAAGATCSNNITGYHPVSVAAFGTCADFWLIKLSVPVVTPPSPVVTIDPASATVCAGVSASIRASARYAGTNPAFSWERNGAPAGTNSPVYTASDFASNDRVKCTITAGGSCETGSGQASDEVIIRINTNNINPQITIAADNTVICDCTPVTFTATVANAGASPVYQWKLNGVDMGVNRPVYINNTLRAGDIITCVYMDKSGCVPGGFAVSNSIQMNAPAGQPPTVSISTPSATICSGSAAVFTAHPADAGATPAYQWKVNGANAGTNSNIFTSSSLANGDKITCSVTRDPRYPCGITGIANSNTITITVVTTATPAVTIITPANTICTGSQASFTAIVTGAGINPSFQWKINGINAGAGSNNFSSSSLADGDVVTCTITADPLFTCVTATSAASNAISMIVKDDVAPSVTIEASDNDVCYGTGITFTATALDAGTAPVYQWKLNGAPAATGSSVYRSSVLKNGDMIVCDVVPGGSICQVTPVSSNSIIAVINDLPLVSILPADTIITTGGTLRLQAVVAGNIDSYEWSPAGKLLDPQALSPVTVPLTDNITYSLAITDDNGCTANAKATVRIFRPLFMPNAFTPGNDGKNDIFRIPADVSLTLKEFSIFNRWGNRVFTTRDIGKGWDGTFGGKPLNTGLFVYLIRGTNDKEEVFLKGSFVLVRQ